MKILLVRLSSMGDLIHTLPAISDLAIHYPDVELHWLCEENFADIARLHPFVDKIIPMAWRKWRKQGFQAIHHIQNLKNILKSENYDLVLDSQGLIKSAFFAKLAGVDKIAGLDWKSAREPIASLFYQQKHEVKKGEDAIWRNRQLFAKIMNYPTDYVDKIHIQPDFGVTIPNFNSENHSENVDYLENIKQNQYIVALHATSKDSKLWAVDNWVQLFQHIHNMNPNLSIYLTWGNEIEKQRADLIAEKFNHSYHHIKNNIKVCPKLNLLEAAFLLKHAQAVIGVDTGLLHLANAVDNKKPIIGIYTDSDPNKTGIQVSDYTVNLGGIGQNPSVEMVFNTYNQLIN